MSLLCGLVDANNKVAGVDGQIVPDPIVKQYNLSPNFVIADIVPANYRDISSILNWEEYGYREELKRDYGYVRSEIKALMQQKAYGTTISTVNDPTTLTPVAGERYWVGTNPIGDFANKQGAIAVVQPDLSYVFRDPENLGYWELTKEEKLIAIKYNLGNLDDHESDPEIGLTESEVLHLNAKYHIDATNNRIKRRLFIETLAHRALPLNKGQLYLEVTHATVAPGFTVNLLDNYADAGVKGIVEDSSPEKPATNPGICDYINGRFPFGSGDAVPGLIHKPWTPRNGQPLSDLVAEMQNVLEHGIYR